MPTGRLSGNITQDWEPVVLRRTKPKAADLKFTKAVNQALRSGTPVETVRKAAEGTNKNSLAAAAPTRKLDETTEPVGLERVGAEVRAAIQKARVAKGWSQAELAKRINERAQVVQEYERGMAVPVQSVLGRMERVGAEARAAIQKARVAKGWSQAEVAKRINERAQVVQEYERGKAVPVQSVLGRMERALEVKLRGKAVGTPRPPAPSDDAREC